MKKHASKLITSFKKVDGEFGVSTWLNEDYELTALIRVQEKSMWQTWFKVKVNQMVKCDKIDA
jgi:hypothetical protein